jgi:hypothetical protein
MLAVVLEAYGLIVANGVVALEGAARRAGKKISTR